MSTELPQSHRRTGGPGQMARPSCCGLVFLHQDELRVSILSSSCRSRKVGCSTAPCSAARGVQQGGREGRVALGQGGARAPRCGPALHSSVQQARYLRHDNHAEVQPVPWVPKEGECVQAEASSQNLDQRLKGVNGSEGVPGGERPAGFLSEAEAHGPGWPGPPHGRSPAPPLSPGALRPGSL